MFWLESFTFFIKFFYIFLIILLENGEIHSWGINYYEQLGHGDNNNRNTPTMIEFFKYIKIIDINCLSFSSIVLSRIIIIQLI